MWLVSRNISILLDFHPRNFPRGLKTNVSCPQINVQHGPSVSVCRRPKMWNLGLSAQQTKLDTMSKDACVIFHILGPMLLSSCTSVLFFIHKVLSGDSHSAFRSYFDLEGFLLLLPLNLSVEFKFTDPSKSNWKQQLEWFFPQSLSLKHFLGSSLRQNYIVVITGLDVVIT